MVLVSLFGVSKLFNIMLDYSDGVWLQEMMQLMLSDDTDSDDGVLVFGYGLDFLIWLWFGIYDLVMVWTFCLVC
jgi:hypothetical protein